MFPVLIYWAYDCNEWIQFCLNQQQNHHLHHHHHQQQQQPRLPSIQWIDLVRFQCHLWQVWQASKPEQSRNFGGGQLGIYRAYGASQCVNTHAVTVAMPVIALIYFIGLGVFPVPLLSSLFATFTAQVLWQLRRAHITHPDITKWLTGRKPPSHLLIYLRRTRINSHWYNRNGWLDVKHQVTYLFTYVGLALTLTDITVMVDWTWNTKLLTYLPT